MKDYYTKNADNFGWGPAHTLPEYKVSELLPLLTGQKILDIGCGPGAFVDVLSNRGFEAVGVDITPKFITFAKKNYQGKFLVADAARLPFDNKSFDTVYIRNVLEHLSDDRQALKEALRVGKKVVIVVPAKTPDNLLKRGLLYSHHRDLSHLRYYTHKDIRQLAESVKAEVSAIQDSEPLPNKSVVFELLSAPAFIKRLLIKFLFALASPKAYYLEIIAIIN